MAARSPGGPSSGWPGFCVRRVAATEHHSIDTSAYNRSKFRYVAFRNPGRRVHTGIINILILEMVEVEEDAVPITDSFIYFELTRGCTQLYPTVALAVAP